MKYYYFSILFLAFGTPLARTQTGSPYLRAFEISEPLAGLENPTSRLALTKMDTRK